MHLSVRKPSRRLAVVLPLTAIVFATGVAAAGSYSSAPPAPASDGVQVTVDLSERQLVVLDGGQAVRSYGVAIGSAKHPTPTGSFRVRRMVWNPGWVPPKEKWAKGKKARDPGDPKNPMQAVKIFFREPDYYIHGTPYVGSLGKAASHGCLRMDPVDAAEVAQYVMEHGGQPRDENWFWRTIHARSQTKVVNLRNPIPMTIIP